MLSVVIVGGLPIDLELIVALVNQDFRTDVGFHCLVHILIPTTLLVVFSPSVIIKVVNE